MPRLLFEKTGNAVWVSHLDLMRIFQRAFKRAGLLLKHTQGFNPRPSVSIALPLSVGVESRCELLDFDLEGEKVSNDEILARLNPALVNGVRVLTVYDSGDKIKNLAYLDCVAELEYDNGIPSDAVIRISDLFAGNEILVEKKGKNGISEQNITPMIRHICVSAADGNTLRLKARVCCQNPSLNPALLIAAVSRYLPDLKPDFAKSSRIEIYDINNNIFR